MEEKIKKMLEILQDLPYWKWNYIKSEVDRTYELEQKESVPNSKLETLNQNLSHWCENLSKYKV